MGASDADDDRSIDDVDRRLIDVLLADGRASFRTVAEEAGVAATTAARRIARLEDAGIIEGYAPVVGYDALGYDIAAVFHLKVDGGNISAVTDRLRERREIVSVYEVVGDYDVIAVGRFTDPDALNARIKALLTDEEVRAANTSLVLSEARGHEEFTVE